MGRLIGLVAIAATVILYLGEHAAVAQSKGDECGAINQSVFETEGSVPDELIGDPALAVSCLVKALDRISTSVTTPAIAEPERNALNRAAGALSRIIDSGVPDAIRLIRNADTLEAASVLAFGARSADYTTRLNSTVLLSNIIDNSTVCVVMDHLADPALTATQDGINGRANLLAVASVVAPWAMKSNFQNMEKLIDYARSEIADEKDVAQTTKILTNFEARLVFQETLEPSKQNKIADSAESKACWAWKPLYSTNSAFSIKYPTAVVP